MPFFFFFFFLKKSAGHFQVDYIKQEAGPMGHNSLTCIFANAMQQSSSIATVTGTQI